jgi:hypothetical protein
MKTLDGTFEVETTICATSYLFNPNLDARFELLADCAQNAGLSRQCALVWAHLGAASVAAGCVGDCTADPFTGLSTLNGPAPTCEFAECMACPEAFNEFFYAISGRTLVGSGMTERTARPCSEFTGIVHDPCVGATETISPAPTITASPTIAPAPASSAMTMTPFWGLVSSPHGLLMSVLLVLLASWNY